MYNFWYDLMEKYPDSESYFAEPAIYRHKEFSSIKLTSEKFILAEVEYDNGNTALVENISYCWGKSKVSKRRSNINLITGNKAEKLESVKSDLDTIPCNSKSYYTTYWK